jgi:hypothetical protein
MRSFGGGQEFVEHLVHAILPAQVFGNGVDALGRVQYADVKIAILGIGYKPMVGLLYILVPFYIVVTSLVMRVTSSRAKPAADLRRK